MKPYRYGGEIPAGAARLRARRFLRSLDAEMRGAGVTFGGFEPLDSQVGEPIAAEVLLPSLAEEEQATVH